MRIFSPSTTATFDSGGITTPFMIRRLWRSHRLPVRRPLLADLSCPVQGAPQPAALGIMPAILRRACRPACVHFASGVSMLSINNRIAEELGVRPQQVAAAVALQRYGGSHLLR